MAKAVVTSSLAPTGTHPPATSTTAMATGATLLAMCVSPLFARRFCDVVLPRLFPVHEVHVFHFL